MDGIMTEVGKLIAKPINKIDDAQKSFRNAAANVIKVGEEKGEVPSPQKREKFEDLEDPDEQFWLQSLRHWDVKMPATRPKKKFGYSVPSLRRNFTKKRRITIELYTKGPQPGQDPKELEYDRRVFKKLHPRASLVESATDTVDIQPLGEEDYILFRILKAVKPKKGVAGAYEWDDDESHASSHHNGTVESNQLITYNVKDYGDGQSQEDTATHWIERQRARIPILELKDVTDKSIAMNIGAGENAVLREFKFESSHEVQTFVETLNKMRELMHERAKRMAAEHRMNFSEHRPSDIDGNAYLQTPSRGLLSSILGGTKEHEGSLSEQPVNLLIEVVSASNLPIADIVSSDPFVVVQDGRTIWHTTGVVSKTLNPVWTLSTGSLFLIQTNLYDFFAKAAHIEFIVKDHDTIGSDDILASVLVNKTDLINGKGKRVDYELTTKMFSGKRNDFIGEKKSFLTLRAKAATDEEISFIQSFEAKKETGIMSKLGMSSGIVSGVFADDSSLPPRTHSTKWKQSKRDSDGVTIKYRVKPFEDPTRPETTEWLTEREIEHECKKPSENWIETGSGCVGKFYVEILGCNDLPNSDISMMGNKSDPFVCISFEDSVVNTDVINDCLSPRWMPWSQRAFVFNVMHPSSQFYIAVMDHDGMKSSHDKLGRCVLNPSNARTNTIYNFRYHLRDNDHIDRKVTGKILLRVRFECSTPRQYLISAFQFRKEFRISTTNYSDSQAIAFAVTNDYDRYALSLFKIQEYVDELFEYQFFLDDIVDGINTIILWRGHFEMQFFSYSFKAPFHSMVAFTWGILLSLDFDRIISFFCFLVAWILFATLQVQRANPNPWKRPRTYIDMLSSLILNKTFVHQRIKENENIEAIMNYDEHRAERMKLRKEAVDRMTVQNEQDAARLAEEKKELDKQTEDHSAKVSVGINEVVLSPFRDIIYPVQRYLFLACVYLRVGRNVLMWRDSVLAFWIATFALSLSAISFFVPWMILFRWGFRIAAFVFLGPWMKLVDIFFVENDENLTREERRAKLEKEMKERYEFLLSQSKITRLYQEHQMKFNDMHKYLYGEYGHRVPVFKEERFGSVPLSGGSAEPYDPLGEPPPNIIRRINGQLLEGTMVMTRRDSVKEFKALQKQKQLEESKIPIDISIDSGKDEMEPLLEGDEESSRYGAVEV